MAKTRKRTPAAQKGTNNSSPPSAPPPPSEESQSPIYEYFLGEDVVIEYMDATDKISEAEGRGETVVSLPIKFLAKWIPQVFRMDDPETAEAWNRSCDSAGMQSHKVPVPGARDTGARLGPMALRKSITVSGPLKFKKLTKDEEDAGGPF